MTIELKLLFAIICVVVSVSCTSQDSSNAKIVNYAFNRNKFGGGYFFKVDTSDGFHHDASAYLKNYGTKQESLTVRGSYSYIAPDGVTYTINYIADENGFQPYGKHIPQFGAPPPTPGVSYSYGCVSATLSGCGLG